MNVQLPEEWECFIRDQVRSGHYASEASVVREALSLLKQRDQQRPRDEAPEPSPSKPIGEIIDELMSDLPDEVLQRLPVDGAAQHDHSIYGLPKRPS